MLYGRHFYLEIVSYREKSMKLNCDMGESYGVWTMGMDTDVMPYVDMANIACGFHASDPMIMAKTVQLAKVHHVAIGAHPSYPDLLGFGRRDMHFSTDEITHIVLYQVGALHSICYAQGVSLDYVKPHGALYNTMMKDEAVFESILHAMTLLPISVPLMILATDQAAIMRAKAHKQGVQLLLEAFCDRAYTDEGKLVSRDIKGAVLDTDEAITARVEELIVNKQITTISGKKLDIDADTICVHGDSAHALESVKTIRQFITSLSL